MALAIHQMNAQPCSTFPFRQAAQHRARRGAGGVFEDDDIQAGKVRIVHEAANIRKQAANFVETLAIRDHAHDQVDGRLRRRVRQRRVQRVLTLRGRLFPLVERPLAPAEAGLGAAREGLALLGRHPPPILAIEAIKPRLLGSRTGSGEPRPRPVGEVFHGWPRRRAVRHVRQIRDADAQVAVRATRQRLVEQAGLQQHAQAADQIAALDARIASQEIRRGELGWRRHQTLSGVLFDPPERRRHCVQAASLDRGCARCQVLRQPAVVVVQDGNVDM